MAVFFKKEIPARANRTNTPLYNETEEQLKSRPGEPAIVAVAESQRELSRWMAAGRERGWKMAQRSVYSQGVKYWNIWAWWPLDQETD